MSDVAVRCEGLGKKYRLGQAARYKALRDTLTDMMSAPVRIARKAFQKSGTRNGNGESILWALREVSFEIKEGEVVGIIGRNGAGKSTLLKILSRITRPTEGKVLIHGRVGSLLEVGTGFHPELTGRENIYLNGSILGMRKTEIERKFDEIVAFAEVEEFIDTPVKRYSSGMYVRLAFAVAAHLEPEILVVDEVLAVGDAAFQKKCLGKMGDVAKQGRTVLLVSHNMTVMRSLCQKIIYLDKGSLVSFGETPETIALYEKSWLESQESDFPAGTLFEEEIDPQREFQVYKIEMLDKQGKPKQNLLTWDAVKFRLHYHAKRTVTYGSAVFKVATLEGVPLMLCSTQPDSNVEMRIKSGQHWVDCEFVSWPLAAGRYVVSGALAIPMKEWLTHLNQNALLEVEEKDVFQSGTIVPHMSRALLATPHAWNVQA